MTIKKLSGGMLDSNCYIAGDNGEAIVIDPGVKEERILAAAAELGLAIKYIILTHVHIDHIAYADKLKARTGAQTVAHRLDAAYMSDAWYNGAKLFGRSDTFGQVDTEVEDGGSVTAGGIEFTFLHTPGHTPGGMCVSFNDGAQKYVFTGDTLFYMSIGNTSLGNGDADAIDKSIREKLYTLPESTIVLPGHGKQSTIGFEKANNPYVSAE